MDQMFDDAQTPAGVIGQLVGACSVTRLWDEMPQDYPSGAGTFIDDRAKALVDAALAALERLESTGGLRITSSLRDATGLEIAEPVHSLLHVEAGGLVSAPTFHITQPVRDLALTVLTYLDETEIVHRTEIDPVALRVGDRFGVAVRVRHFGNVVISVAGNCPACGGRSLALTGDDELACIYQGCPRPSAVHELLSREQISSHRVRIEEGGFSIEHPLVERLDGQLFTCALHVWLLESFQAPRDPGNYLVHPLADGGWIYIPTS